MPTFTADVEEVRIRARMKIVEGSNLSGMSQADLIAARVVIEVCPDRIRSCGGDEPRSPALIATLLRDEADHARELSDLLFVVDPHRGQTERQDPGSEPMRFG